MLYPDLEELRTSIKQRAESVEQGIQIPRDLCQRLKDSWDRCLNFDNTGFRIRSGSAGDQEAVLSHRYILLAAIGSELTERLLDYRSVYTQIFETLGIGGERQKQLFTAATNSSNVGAEWGEIERELGDLGLEQAQFEKLKRFALDNHWSGCTKGIGRGDFFISAVCHSLGTNPTNQPMLATASKDFLSSAALKRITAELLEVANGSHESVNQITSNLFDSKHITVFLEALDDTGLAACESLFVNFLAALTTKPFVILTGNSGTGKTKLAELFAEWFCGKETDRLALIPVGADWTDNRNVLGFVNHIRPTQPEGEEEVDVPVYQSTGILDLLLAADKDPANPYFLILDEMNLSHVERYFADFLSAMESRHGELHLHREDRRLPRKPSGPADVPESLPMPRNVFVIGTVNVDETTYMFSPKVLDRANVIEFRVDSTAPKTFLESGGKPILKIDSAPAGYAEAFLELSKRARGLDGTAPLALVADSANPPEGAKAGLRKCIETIADLFALMQTSHQEFAFRSMSEILRFLAVDYELTPDDADWNWQAAMDAQILQKILPKLHGSKRKLGPLLASLAAYCEKGVKADAEKTLESQSAVETYAAEGDKKCADPLFKGSHRKLCEMILTVRRDQFVSFIQ
jgi:MoxR-like ATPase